MSSNASSNENTLLFTSASDLTPPAIDLNSSSNDSSIIILNDTIELNDTAEDTLLAGGDNNRNRLPSLTTPMKNNSNEFIRNEAVTSTPAVPTSAVVTPRSDGKRKRAESPELMSIDDDSGAGSDDDMTTTSNATGDTVSAAGDEVKVDLTAANYDPATGIVLPDTVTVLTTPTGATIYLIGTAHFSIESQDDVSLVIQAVQPHVVCIELCNARRSLLEMNETMLEQASTMNLATIRAIVNQQGLANGLVQVLLQNLSAHLTRELGMVPGGEFRRAVDEVRRLNNCIIHLCDRPIGVTLKRALRALTWWQTTKLVWHLLTTNETVTKADVERCKQRDLLEDMLKEMCGDFPEIGTVFVHERDIYLAYSLQIAAEVRKEEKTRVVAVVGMGHVPGITQLFGTVTNEDIKPIMEVPPPSLSSRVVGVVAKASLVGLAMYAGYRLFPYNYIRATLM